MNTINRKVQLDSKAVTIRQSGWSNLTPIAARQRITATTWALASIPDLISLAATRADWELDLRASGMLRKGNTKVIIIQPSQRLIARK
jgi:hypothetical protein